MPTNGFITIVQQGQEQRIAGPCQHGWEHYDPMPAPYAEILDPDTNQPRIIIDTCGAAGTHFSILGTALKLPGSVSEVSVRLVDSKTGQEWLSESARLEVTEFGGVDQPVKGTFEAVMAPRLNRPAEKIRGTFELPRAADRYRP